MGEQLTAYVASIFGEMGYGAIFCLMALESSVFPVPSEAVMIPAGYLAAVGKLDPFLATLVGGLGSVLGALANYYVLGRWLGKPFLEKYGRYVLVPPEKYARAEAMFLRGAGWATFVGRFIPVVRHFISIPAGMFRMPLLPFLLLTWLGSTLWCGVLVGAGYFWGEGVVALFGEYAHLFALALAAMVGLAALRWAIKAVRARWGRGGLFALALLAAGGAYGAGFSLMPDVQVLAMFPKGGPAKVAYAAEMVYFTGSQGNRLSAAYTGSAVRGTVLYFHGNGQPLALLESHLAFFTKQGYAILAPDYPSYGESRGFPTEAAVFDMAERSYGYLTGTLGVPEKSIVVVGYSIGTGSASWLASRYAPGALVLLAPFQSVQSMSRALYGVAFQKAWFLPDVFDNAAHVRDVRSPTLVVHGDADELVPYAQGRAVADASGAARKRFATLPGAGHNGLFSDWGPLLAGEWRDFFGIR